MTASNSTNSGTGSIGEFAIGEFTPGSAFDWSVSGFVLSEPVRQKINPLLAVALITSGFIGTMIPEQGSLTGSWYLNLSEPVKVKPRLTEANQQFLAYVAAPTQNLPLKPAGSSLPNANSAINFAEQSQFDKWNYPFSEPKRFKSGLASYYQQTFTSDSTPIPISKGMGWYASLTEPVRIKPALGTGLHQYLAFYPLPYVNFSYIAQLSEPIRVKPGVLVGDQQFLFFEPEPPVLEMLEWYAWLSEPVRIKQGLPAWQMEVTARAELVVSPFSYGYIIA